MWNDELKEFRNAKFWGVGNGWALTGITRVIESIQEGMAFFLLMEAAWSKMQRIGTVLAL